MAHKATTEILVSGVTPPSYTFTRMPSAGLVEAVLSLFNAAPGTSTSGIMTLSYYYITVLCSRSGAEGTFNRVPDAPTPIYAQCNSLSGQAQVTISSRWWKSGYPYWYVQIELYGKNSSGSSVRVCKLTSDSMYFSAYDVPLDPPSVSIDAKQGDIVKEVTCTLGDTYNDIVANQIAVNLNILMADSKDGEYTSIWSEENVGQTTKIDLREHWTIGGGKFFKFRSWIDWGTFSSLTPYVQLNDNSAFAEIPNPWQGTHAPVTLGNHLLTCLQVSGDADGNKQTYKIKIGERPEIQTKFNTPIYVLLDTSEYFEDPNASSVLLCDCKAVDSLGEGNITVPSNKTIVRQANPLLWTRGERIQKGSLVTAQQVYDLQETTYRFYSGFFKYVPTNSDYVHAGDLVKAETITTLQNMIDEVLATTGLVTPPQWIRVKKGDKISAAPLNQLREFFEYL